MANSDPDPARRVSRSPRPRRPRPCDRATGMASLFDLRMVIGGLLVPVRCDLDRHGPVRLRRRQGQGRPGSTSTSGAGLVILAGGAIFLAWARLRPLKPEDLQDTDTDRPNVE